MFQIGGIVELSGHVPRNLISSFTMFHKIGSQVVRCSTKQQLELGRKTCVNLSKPKAPESVSEINFQNHVFPDLPTNMFHVLSSSISQWNCTRTHLLRFPLIWTICSRSQSSSSSSLHSELHFTVNMTRWCLRKKILVLLYVRANGQTSHEDVLMISQCCLFSCPLFKSMF